MRVDASETPRLQNWLMDPALRLVGGQLAWAFMDAAPLEEKDEANAAPWPKDDIEYPFTLGELFCGPGGFALGAISARSAAGPNAVQIVPGWATDIDPDACATYTTNILADYPDHQAICCDVRELNFEELSAIDALAFGFPCNDYSILGEHKGVHGAYGPLYKYGVKALEHFQPLWFVAENVGGLRSANDGVTIRRILSELEAAGEYGYNLTPHYYRFEEYGLPQLRHRFIIVGLRRDLMLSFRVPAPRFGPAKTARMALDRPMPEQVTNHEISRVTPVVEARLNKIEPGQNAFTADLDEKLRLNIRGATLSMIYRRLHPDQPSYTVTGSGGGGTYMYHWKEPRALTNRERARLQSFPDSYKFVGTRASVRRQIGMAVPCLAAQIICEAILDTFNGRQYKSVEPNYSR